MAEWHIRKVSEELALAVKLAALERRVSVQAYICEVLAAVVGSPAGVAVPQVGARLRRAARTPAPITNTIAAVVEASSGTHNTKDCRVYRCLQCAALGYKDARRGLG